MKKTILIIIVHFLTLSLSNAAMIEYISPQLGDISWFELDGSSICKLNNKIVVSAKDYSILTLDIEDSRVIDIMSLRFPYKILYVGIISEYDNGWFLYIYAGKTIYKIAKVHIDPDGIFSKFIFLDGTYERLEFERFLVDDINKRIWLFGDRVRTIEVLTNKIREIEYPESWQGHTTDGILWEPTLPLGNSYIVLQKSYQKENLDDVHLYAHINTKNLIVSELPFSNNEYCRFFPKVNHENKLLFRKYKKDAPDYKIYEFDCKDISIVTIIDIGEEYGVPVFDQEKNIAFIPMDINESKQIKSIGVIDLMSGSFEKKSLKNVPEGLYIDFELIYGDFVNKLFAKSLIYNENEYGDNYMYLVEIDIETFEVEITNHFIKSIFNAELIEGSSKIILNSMYQVDPYYTILDIGTKDYIATIDLLNYPETFEDHSKTDFEKIITLDRFGKTAKLLDIDNFYLKNYNPRRFNRVKDCISNRCYYLNISLFPDECGFISKLSGEGIVFYDFLTEETTSYEINGYNFTFGYKDLMNNRIITTMNSANDTLLFLENDVTFTSWTPGTEYSFLDILVNSQTGKTYAAASKKNDMNIYIFEWEDIHEEPVSYKTFKLPNERFHFMTNPSGIDLSFFIMGYNGANKYIFKEWSPFDDSVLFSTDIYTYKGFVSELDPCWVYLEDRGQVFLYDGSGSWLYDAKSRTMKYGSSVEDPQHSNGTGIFVDYESSMNKVVVADLYDPEDQKIIEITPENGNISKTIQLPDDYYENVYFNLPENKLHLIKKSISQNTEKFNPQIVTVHLDGWENAPIIKPRTNNVEYHPGNTLKLEVTINNPGPAVDVTAYIWFWLSDSTFVCFDCKGIYLQPNGIKLILPENTNTSFDLFSLVLPGRLPEGYWTANAFFINNETGKRGPVSNYNFYYRDI